MTDASSEVDLAAIRERYVDKEFDAADFEMDPERMVGWAEACGEEDPRFIDLDHPDFQAHPTYTAHCVTRKVLPDDFPQIGSGFGIDGGKAVTVHAPIRAGETLHGSATIADVYDKTGRSGTMYFIVQRMSFTNPAGELVSTVDWKQIRGA